MQSDELLNSFTEFCKKHPDQRFYQALVNWSDSAFIYMQREGNALKTAIGQDGGLLKVEDVFYK